MKTVNKCLNCGSELKGRSDKKFCDAVCRNTFNNKNIRSSEKIIKETNRLLRKNRSILQRINPQGRTTIRKEYLVMQGFNFRYYTHTYQAKNGNTYYFCYEYGYMPLDQEKYVIVNWQNYMGKM